MEKRGTLRIPRRLTCEIVLADGRRTSGIIRDLSERGVFVQTLASPNLNSVVEVVFVGSDHQLPIRVEAGVARKRVVPARLQAIMPAGIGLELLPPRTDYERWVFRPARPALDRSDSPLDAFAAQPEQRVRAYRFHLIHPGRVENQVLTIRCESEGGARARALARAGAGWKIADAESL